MKAGPAVENVVAAIAESCRSGLEPAALRSAVLARLRRAIPIDALWWATVDPATLLFTQAYREGIPAATAALKEYWHRRNQPLLSVVNLAAARISQSLPPK